MKLTMVYKLDFYPPTAPPSYFTVDYNLNLSTVVC